MKLIFVSSVFLFIFSLTTFAQINETAPCPTISITGPPGIVEPNDSAVYVANVDTKGNDLKIEYVWSVNVGEILEGQATNTLKVKQPEFGSLTVTVEVKGFPPKCPNITSETLVCALRPTATLFDEFLINESRIDKARLDNLINELQNNPTAVAHIIEKFEPEISANNRKLKMRKLSDYLFKTRKIEKDRIVIRYANANKTLTQFFIVPAGAKPPDCEGCYI